MLHPFRLIKTHSESAYFFFWFCCAAFRFASRFSETAGFSHIGFASVMRPKP